MGACPPLVIHCDKSKAKEKEEEERRKQRAGEKSTEQFVRDQFLGGISLPEVKVLTTRNGSMTQETFEKYAHFLVNTLLNNQGPKILFLDGHGSCWNHQTLLYLIENKIFPFFFASHTSIWSQPNDGETYGCTTAVLRKHLETDKEQVAHPMLLTLIRLFAMPGGDLLRKNDRS